jgi:hypothetical protein
MELTDQPTKSSAVLEGQRRRLQNGLAARG